MQRSSMYDVPVDVPMRKALMILILDDSVRMNEPFQNVLRSTIEELLPELVDLEDDLSFIFYLRTLTYNISAKWHEEDAVRIDKYSLPHLSGFGLSNFGEACYKLNDYLSAERIVSYNNPIYYSFEPIIVFCIRSNPTGEYIYGLNKLSRNGFYKYHCNKMVFFLGEENVDIKNYDTLFSNDNKAKEIRRLTPKLILNNLVLDELKEDWFI